MGFSNEAGQIFELAISRKAIELVSASSVTDIFYVLHRAFKDREVALEKLKDIRTVIILSEQILKTSGSVFLYLFMNFHTKPIVS